jgi:hypothetical protein
LSNGFAVDAVQNRMDRTVEAVPAGQRSTLTTTDCFRLSLSSKSLSFSCLGVSYPGVCMTFPIKVCAICSEEFELKPDKPGFANRCPECSAPDSVDPVTRLPVDKDQLKSEREANEARRQAIRDLLYRKDG